jgi:hypothetical protein
VLIVPAVIVLTYNLLSGRRIASYSKRTGIDVVMGAGVGAGSTFIQGRDNLDLLNSTEFAIHASVPR